MSHVKIKFNKCDCNGYEKCVCILSISLLMSLCDITSAYLPCYFKEWNMTYTCRFLLKKFCSLLQENNHKHMYVFPLVPVALMCHKQHASIVE